MRIAFVCHEYPPLPHGGIGTFVETVARGFHQRGHYVTVVGLGEKDEERMQDGVRVVHLRRNRARLVGNLLSRLQLKNWLQRQSRTGGFDVIEVPDFQGSIPFALKNCSVVVRLHLAFTAICLQAGNEPSKGIRIYERRTLACNPNWIAVSKCILDITQNTFALRPALSAVIYNPVPTLPTDRVDTPELPSQFVLFAGQLSHRKGAVILAAAAREFLISHTDVHLVYVGGEIKREGGALCSRVNLSDPWRGPLVEGPFLGPSA